MPTTTSGFFLQCASRGTLELVLPAAGDRLAALWCAREPPRSEPSWSEPRFFAEGAAGDPALIQGGFGGRGNFELVVPHASGGIAHYHRDNDTAELGWRGPAIFGAEL